MIFSFVELRRTYKYSYLKVHAAQQRHGMKPWRPTTAVTLAKATAKVALALRDLLLEYRYHTMLMALSRVNVDGFRRVCNGGSGSQR